MRVFFPIMLILCVSGLFAAPLDGGFHLAPRASASPEEKSQAYMNARLNVIAAAKKYEGVPYLHGGVTAAGLDCSGFIVLSFRDALGVSLPRTTTGLYTWTESISLENAQPGDLLFFRTGTNRNITHAGIYLGSRTFIHSASAGANTGVIYSSLDEQYWAHTFAGAGRAIPETASFTIENVTTDNTAISNVIVSGEQINVERHVVVPAANQSGGGNWRLLIGAAAAPMWGGFVQNGNIVRGFSSQLFVHADTYLFGPRMIIGLEVRPEYDGAFGVFHLPITLSWGLSEKFRVFAGPVISFGDAVGGTNWAGTLGLTAAPFTFNSAYGKFAPYIELAHQSHSSDSRETDFLAGFRFSTGIRWMLQVR